VVAQVAANYRFPISSTVVAEPGISAVRNAILDEARRGGDEFIAMIDDDETASHRWLDNLLATRRRTGAAIVGGPCHPDFQADPSEAAKLYWAPRTYPEGPVETIRGTGNCLISASAMSALDWPRFDQSFGLTGGEDTEWFRRLRGAGADFAWSENALTHETVPASRTTWRWAIRRHFRTGNHAVRILRLHRDYGRLSRDVSRSLARLLIIPLRIPELFGEKRWRLLCGWAVSAGMLSGLAGYVYPEYRRQL
jgi:succinoglycan biosynthesis protein ExoM